MSKSINDIRCEFIDNSNELKEKIGKYYSIVMDLQNINILSFKILKNQEEFTSLCKFIIDLNEIITQLIDYFKDVIKEEEELPNSKIAKTSFPDLKEKPSTPEDKNSTMNPMMGGILNKNSTIGGMNPMMGGMGMNPMMGGMNPMMDGILNKNSTIGGMNPMMGGMNPMMGGMGMNPMMGGMNPIFSENTESTNKEDLNSSKKENESENTESE